MKTGVDLVCQREQNSLSRDFLRKLHRSGNEPFSCLSIIFLLYPGASAVFQHSTILSTSVLQSDVAQVLYQEIYSLHLSIHLLFVSVHSNLFMKDPTFSRRIKGVSIVKRHCVCLDVFLHDSIYPCILSTDSYLSSVNWIWLLFLATTDRLRVAKQLVKQRTWSEPKFSNLGFDHEVSFQATWQKSLIISGDLY